MPFENLDPSGLISDFTGADENPLSEGGNWAALNSSSTNNLILVSNAASVSGTGATIDGSYWTLSDFGPDLEAYITVSTVGGGTSRIAARLQGVGGSNTWDGYTVACNIVQTTISRITNGNSATLMVVSQAYANGDKLGMRITGDVIQAWRQPSGSGTWTLMVSATDAVYRSAGKIGLVSNSTDGRIDDFYAATGNIANMPLVTA